MIGHLKRHSLFVKIPTLDRLTLTLKLSQDSIVDIYVIEIVVQTFVPKWSNSIRGIFSA